jgi:proteasome accessory factor C
MAKSQATPVERAARLLDLVPYISTHQGISLQDLANEFSVSQNELLNDLNTLWMCGLPGYTPLELIDLEFESGYVSIRNAEVLQRVRLLTKQELVVILLGLDILKSSLEDSRADLLISVSTLSEKIKKIVGDIATASPIVDSAHRATIVQAIKSRKDINLVYHSTIRDSVTERLITPLELSLDLGFEVLYAYCHSAEGFRTFRLDNIKTVSLGKSSVEVPSKKAESDFNWEILIKSRFRTSSERFRSDYLARQIVETQPFLVKSFSQDWLLRNAICTLASVEVQGPPEARALVAEKCRQTLNLYENSGFSTR